MLEYVNAESTIFPGRTLSANDSAGKRRLRLRRSPLSDLGDESGAVHEDELIAGIEISVNYCELVTIAGVSDIPDIYTTSLDDNGPPRAPIMMARRKQLITAPTAKALISMTSPHKLLIVTKEFCDLFGYCADSEICGRALKTLFGPRTDISAVASGLQSVATIDDASYYIALYNCNGEDINMRVNFTPYMTDSQTLAGCLLELVPGETSSPTSTSSRLARE